MHFALSIFSLSTVSGIFTLILISFRGKEGGYRFCAVDSMIHAVCVIASLTFRFHASGSSKEEGGLVLSVLIIILLKNWPIHCMGRCNNTVVVLELYTRIKLIEQPVSSPTPKYRKLLRMLMLVGTCYIDLYFTKNSII